MMNEVQIKGQIAAKESELQQLAVSHERLVRSFDQQVVANRALYERLTGNLETLKGMLNGQSPADGKPPKKKKQKNA